MPSKSNASSHRERAVLRLPASQDAVQPALQFVASCAQNGGLEGAALQQLKDRLKAVLDLVIQRYSDQASSTQLEMRVSGEGDELSVGVLNRGNPIYPTDLRSHGLDSAITYKNLGKRGQALILKTVQRKNTFSTTKKVPSLQSTETFQIRELLPGEEHLLSSLFYRVYGYEYINDIVYNPDKIREKIQEKILRSFVAVEPDGRLIGHVGIWAWNQDPGVIEVALGITDPTIKSRGLFGKLFETVMVEVEKTRRLYCVYDLVTNHDFSQRIVTRFGSREMALFVGSQVSETQAKLSKLGMGSDSPDMDRYSILLAINPGDQAPFGREIAMPVHMGEMAEFVLKPLGLGWTPCPRFNPLPEEGDYTVSFQETQKAIIFDLHRPGRKALQKILNDWQYYLRNGYEYCAIDLPLAAPGFGQLYDHVAAYGFFVAGFLPYRFGKNLGFRLQALGPKKVGFDDIKVYSPTAKGILNIVRRNFERNRVI